MIVKCEKNDSQRPLLSEPDESRVEQKEKKKIYSLIKIGFI